MPANECLPYKRPGAATTAKATAAVTGKRFLAISGNRTGGPGLSTDLSNVHQVAHCGAGGRAYGVSTYDAASGSLVGVESEPGIELPVEAGATIAAGDVVMSDAVGRAVPYVAGAGVHPRGLALNGAASGADAEIKLF